MHRLITLLLLLTMGFGSALQAVDSTFLDYQNYNHGYCPECSCAPCQCDSCAAGATCGGGEPCSACDPCAPVCGAECGISICAIAVAVTAVVIAGAIILTAGDGSSSEHSANT